MLVAVLMTMTVLVAMLVLVADLRLCNVRVRLFVLAENRPIGCPKVAHEITLAS